MNGRGWIVLVGRDSDQISLSDKSVGVSEDKTTCEYRQPENHSHSCVFPFVSSL